MFFGGSGPKIGSGGVVIMVRFSRGWCAGIAVIILYKGVSIVRRRKLRFSGTSLKEGGKSRRGSDSKDRFSRRSLGKKVVVSKRFLVKIMVVVIIFVV